MNEGKTISEQMNDSANEICERYCKYPEICLSEVKEPDLAEDKLYNDYCAKCPLNKI